MVMVKAVRMLKTTCSCALRLHIVLACASQDGAIRPAVITNIQISKLFQCDRRPKSEVFGVIQEKTLVKYLCRSISAVRTNTKP